jgi:hypothetical protein
MSSGTWFRLYVDRDSCRFLLNGRCRWRKGRQASAPGPPGVMPGSLVRGSAVRCRGGLWLVFRGRSA